MTARSTGGSSRNRREADDESFGSTVVGTFTDPSRLMGALVLALGLGLTTGAALRFRNRRPQPEPGEPLERRPRAATHAAPSERVPHERQIDRAARERANRQKSELLDLVSRELRAPLDAMKGFVDTVRLDWGVPGVRARLSPAHGGRNRLGRWPIRRRASHGVRRSRVGVA